MKKRGQLNMSFGMMFSIILIIIFLAFAFYAIKTFLNLGSSAQTGKFASDIQNDINNIWRSAQSSQQETYNIPTSIKQVCFADFNAAASGPNSYLYNNLSMYYSGTQNMVLYPVSNIGLDVQQINNINLSGMTKDENPYCIRANSGNIQVVLQKNISQGLVTVLR